MEKTGVPNSIKSFIKVHSNGNCAIAVFQGMQPSFKNIHQLHRRASIWKELMSRYELVIDEMAEDSFAVWLVHDFAYRWEQGNWTIVGW